jgi:hypothetical protein
MFSRGTVRGPFGPRRIDAMQIRRQRLAVALGAVVWCAAGATLVTDVGAETPRPTPQVSPVHERGPETGANEKEPDTGLPEVGVGRSMGSAKSSGDEGGTAAGMPGKGPDGK